MKITLNQLVLASGLSRDESPESLAVRATGAVQTLGRIGAAYISQESHGNLRNEIDFVLSREFASPLEAITFALGHPQAVAALGPVLSIEVEDGPRRQYWRLEEATATCLCRPLGPSVRCEYRIRGGRIALDA